MYLPVLASSFTVNCVGAIVGDIVGADVVELAPDYDKSEVSTAVVTKIIRDVLMIM